MTYLYYRTSNTWSGQPQVPEETTNFWKHLSDKANWRISQLPNGYYQTEYKRIDESWCDVTRRETIESAEEAIDSSIEHYTKKLEYLEGPKVVKTFDK